MLEQFGNIWDMAEPGDAIVITTNGATRGDGAAIMGRGIARQFIERIPSMQIKLGRLLRDHGNHVFDLGRMDGIGYYSFPVKHHWREPADVKLIRRSAEELKYIAVEDRIWLPRPGCGNGRLRWEEVKPIIEPFLDDRFIAVETPPGETTLTIEHHGFDGSGTVRIGHGDRCVMLMVEGTTHVVAGIVLTSGQARVLADSIRWQADASEGE